MIDLRRTLYDYRRLVVVVVVVVVLVAVCTDAASL
jgi:hypothetical protein